MLFTLGDQCPQRPESFHRFSKIYWKASVPFSPQCHAAACAPEGVLSTLQMCGSKCLWCGRERFGFCKSDANKIRFGYRLNTLSCHGSMDFQKVRPTGLAAEKIARACKSRSDHLTVFPKQSPACRDWQVDVQLGQVPTAAGV